MITVNRTIFKIFSRFLFNNILTFYYFKKLI